MSRKHKGIKDKLKQAEQLLYKGNYYESIQLITLFEEKQDLSPSDLVTCKLFWSQIRTKIGDFEEGLTLANQAMKKSQELGKILEEIDACIAIARTFEGLEKYDKSLKIIEQGEN